MHHLWVMFVVFCGQMMVNVATHSRSMEHCVVPRWAKPQGEALELYPTIAKLVCNQLDSVLGAYVQVRTV